MVLKIKKSWETLIIIRLGMCYGTVSKQMPLEKRFSIANVSVG
jgi:hypothetical protein